MSADQAAAGPHAPAVELNALLDLLRGINAGRIAVGEATAAELTGLSGKTLSRASAAGEKTGRRRVGERVIYYLPELREWVRTRPTN